MAFVSGPRQVGKTTTCRREASHYLDWDADSHQRLIVAGQEAVARHLGLHELRPAGERPVVVFDELHKYPRWKSFLKGFFDVSGDRCRVVVTGSSRLDVYRRGGDSLMGRYFLYRMHPFTTAETLHVDPPEALVRPPTAVDEEEWAALWHHGGFPEPFLHASDRFTRRWRGLRRDQLFREDVRDLTRVQEVALVEILGRILAERSGEQIVYANLARDVHVAPKTAKDWVDALCALHFGFLVRPWHRNVTKALRKEPKWYLRDWSGIEDPGRRAETFLACHLLKAVEGWTDLGLGTFELRYLRDRRKREVDFAVIRDGRPWFLVEVKSADGAPTPALHYFQRETGAAHAFQAVIARDHVDADCFAERTPITVPARTLLSQLL